MEEYEEEYEKLIDLAEEAFDLRDFDLRLKNPYAIPFDEAARELCVQD